MKMRQRRWKLMKAKDAKAKYALLHHWFRKYRPKEWSW